MHYNEDLKVTPHTPVGYLNEQHRDLMFLWPCIMDWPYNNYQLDALTIVYS